jgi:SpoVK/Ycf46/Vps4 family AAA+-type ATPase
MDSFLFAFLGFISFNLDLKQIFLIIISYWRPITYLNTISDQSNCDKLLKYITENSIYIQSKFINKTEKIPFGLCVSKNFIAYIHSQTITDQKNSKVENFITFHGNLPEIIKIAELNSSDSTKKVSEINILMKQSSFYDSKYVMKKQEFNFSPTKKQNKIVNSIIDNYHNRPNKIGRYLIYGNSGTGKSFIAKLISKKLNSPLTFQIKLNQPGNTISNVYTILDENNPYKPLIVLLDEWDVIIKNIHEEKNFKPHQWLITEIFNKESYNTFLSETTQMFPNVIYIMTMNTNVDEINKIDSSYLRKGRIDQIFKL